MLAIKYPSELKVADLAPINVLPESHEKLTVVTLICTEPPCKVGAGHVSRTVTSSQI